MILLLFVTLSGTFGLSIVFYLAFLSKKPISTWAKLNPTIQNIAPAITLVYFGVFIAVSIGLVMSSIAYGNYAMLFISIAPILFVLFSAFWSTRNRITYADQFLILLIFLFLAPIIAWLMLLKVL